MSDLLKIENKEVSTEANYLDPVTYVPSHVDGNAGHPDCELGVIIRVGKYSIKVLYCKSRTVQGTIPEDLVWG